MSPYNAVIKEKEKELNMERHTDHAVIWRNLVIEYAKHTVEK
jgi:hypothetical protein